MTDIIEAYHRQFITAAHLRFYFTQIGQRDDIWISPTLCQRLLKELGI